MDLNKRAGELTQEELERVVTIMQNPTQYKVPAWFLNRQKDQVDGKDYHVLANNLESKLRDDLELHHHESLPAELGTAAHAAGKEGAT